MAGFEYTGEVRPAENVLASRYASRETKTIFSDEGKLWLERQLWIAVMEEEAALGVPIPTEAIQAYKDVQSIIDPDSIRKREAITKHDVIARLAEFNSLSGHEYAHRPMTSRDDTDNVEQLQIKVGMGVIHDRMVATLARFASRAVEHSFLPMAGRSHNMPAQTITLGKRFANWGEDLLLAYNNLCFVGDSYPLRGIKGPVGTQQDILELLGSKEKVAQLEQRIAERLGFTAVLGSVGQTYPRSLDSQVLSALQQAAAGPSSFAETLRLMAGNLLVIEGFEEGQKGSSAMAHKKNPRTAERIKGLKRLLNMYAAGAGANAGEQWNEGDVTDSVVRRVIIPDSFYAADGLFQATLTVLDKMVVYPAVVDSELHRYLPFLTTTKVLATAVESGVSREQAYEIIQGHALAVAQEMQEQGLAENDLLERVAADKHLPVSKQELDEAVGNPLNLTGLAEDQVADFVGRVQTIVDKYPKAASYQPEPLL